MFKSLLANLKVFVAERGWSTYHSPQNMATCLMVEASELLEHFLINANLPTKELEEELADLLHCILLLSDSLKLEIPLPLPNYLSSGNLPLDLSKKLHTLMDHFSWLKNDEAYRGELSEISLTLQELLSILLLLCKELNVDLCKASENKLELNRKKYPAELVQGVSDYYLRKKSLQKKS